MALKIITKYKELGFKNFFNLVFVRLVNKFLYFNSFVGMTLELKDLPQNFLIVPEGYQARFLSEQEIISFSENPANDLPADFISLALGKGDQCFAILQGNQLASYGWYSQKPTIFIKDLTISVASSWVYMYRGYTLPEHRGKRLYAVCKALALQQFTQQPINGLLACVESINFSSLKSVYRLGFKPIGKIYVISVFNKYLSWTSRNCKQYGISLI